MKKIDAHVHIGRTEKIDRSFSFLEFYSYMEDQGILSSVVMPNVSNKIYSSVLNNNFLTEFYSLEEKKRVRFFPFILGDPDDLDTLRQMEDFFVRGLKIHPSILQIKINSKRWKPFFKVAEKRNIPILVHCGRHPTSHISHLIKAAKKHSNNIFIAAHLGGNASDLINEAINLVKESKLNNLYLDTSAVKLPCLVEKAVNVLGEDKIIFGSDEPYSDLRISIYCLELANIPSKEKIMFNNIKEILEKRK
jgi:predicted TIM-barrel fold metal-dependent hydrolase